MEEQREKVGREGPLKIFWLCGHTWWCSELTSAGGAQGIIHGTGIESTLSVSKAHDLAVEIRNQD